MYSLLYEFAVIHCSHYVFRNKLSATFTWDMPLVIVVINCAQPALRTTVKFHFMGRCNGFYSNQISLHIRMP